MAITLTQEQFKKRYGQEGLDAFKVYNPDTQEVEKPGFLSRVGTAWKERFGEIKKTFGETARGEINPAETGVRVVGDVFGGVGDVVGAALSPQVEKLAQKEWAKPAFEALASGMEKYEEWKNSSELNRRTGEVLEGVVNIADIAVGAKGVGKVAQATGKVAEQAVKTTVRTADDVIKFTAKRLKPTIARLAPKDAENAVKNLNKAYKSAFVENSVTVNRKLTKLANRTGKSSDELVDDLAKEGIIPEVEGKLAKFDTVLDDLTTQQKALRQEIKGILPNFKEVRTLDELGKLAEQNLRKFGNAAELDKSLRELKTKIKSLKTKYGDTINPSQLDEIRVDMNQLTKSFNKEIFTEDVANAIGGSARKIMDDIVPDEAYRKANAELQRLINLEKTIKIFDNTAINIGILGGQLGRFIATVGASGAGLSVAGPGGLVLAGIVAKYGGDFVAKFLRNRKFSQVARDLIKKSLQENPSVLEDLIKQADTSNANYLKRLLLPEKSSAPIVAPERMGDAGRSGVKAVSAKKTTARDTLTGRFKKVFKSE